MMKRIMSALLCLIMVLSLVACNKTSNDDENADLGAYVHMYLTDMVYDFDPAHAFYNESALKVVSLLFDTLFKLEDGKVKKSLVEKYSITEDLNNQEYKMYLTLKETYWSDGTYVSANDVVYSWKRILDAENSSNAAALLYDVKNARAVKSGDASIDDLGVCAVDELEVEVTFEGKIDYDRFIRNLASPVLAPLAETYVEKGEDWAKKAATIVTSGPFKVRQTNYKDGEAKLVLERNDKYRRDKNKDAIDKYVTPYRLIIDYSMTDEEIQKAYEEGSIVFVGDIPLSLRGTYKDVAKVVDAISTHTYFFQTQTLKVPMKYEDELESIAESERIAKEAEESKKAAEATGVITSKATELDSTSEPGSETKKNYSAADKVAIAKRNEEIAMIENINKNAVLFRDSNVTKALSLAIDRNAIAEAVVFAKAANALVPYGLYEAESAKKSFRAVGGKLIETSADVNAAKSLLSAYNTADYTINITVAEYDEVHMLIAEMVKTAWEALGFKVELRPLNVIDNDDYYKYTDSTPTDIKDDLYAEALRAGTFEVIALDYVAYTSDPFSMLAPFAFGFSGEGMDMTDYDYEIPTHITGFNNAEYTKLIEDASTETDAQKRSELLHQAEKLLLDNMPVIPIIFNQNAYLQNADLSKVKANFYTPFVFTTAKLKNYLRFTPAATEITADTTAEPKEEN